MAHRVRFARHCGGRQDWPTQCVALAKTALRRHACSPACASKRCLKVLAPGASISTPMHWSSSLPLAMGALTFPSLAGMGYKRARELIEMPGFPPCINSMLCSPLEEERLSGALILGELIGEGGEVTACMLAYTSEPMAGMLAKIRYMQDAPPYSIYARLPACIAACTRVSFVRIISPHFANVIMPACV
jgi:hypothetical protein